MKESGVPMGDIRTPSVIDSTTENDVTLSLSEKRSLISQTTSYIFFKTPRAPELVSQQNNYDFSHDFLSIFLQKYEDLVINHDIPIRVSSLVNSRDSGKESSLVEKSSIVSEDNLFATSLYISNIKYTDTTIGSLTSNSDSIPLISVCFLGRNFDSQKITLWRTTTMAYTTAVSFMFSDVETSHRLKSVRFLAHENMQVLSQKPRTGKPSKSHISNERKYIPRSEKSRHQSSHAATEHMDDDSTGYLPTTVFYNGLDSMSAFITMINQVKI